MFVDYAGLWVLDKDLKIIQYRNPVMEDGSVFNQATYKLLFESADEALYVTNKGLYIYNVSTNKLRPVKYELINEEIQGSIWIKDIIRLNDGSALFSTYAGLYHVTKESGKYITRLISFLKPGGYIGFGPLFQDKAGMIYIKTLGKTLYILKPVGHGKEFELVKEISFGPEINQYLSGENNDSLIYLATSEGLYRIK
jgi:hypothetical protein